MDTAGQSDTRRIVIRYGGIMAAVYVAWICLYELTAWMGQARGPAFDVALAVDARIPFIPAAQPVYLLCYVLPLCVFFISLRPDFLNRLYATFIVMNLAAFAFFAAFPVQGPPREAAADAQSLWMPLIDMIRAVDSRYNAFPSLHVANAWLIALFAFRLRGADLRALLFLLAAAGISAATLLVHQHYVADVASGVALAGAAFAAGKGKAGVAENATRVNPGALSE
jgi:membrane-associated phospholipid phosphatase